MNLADHLARIQEEENLHTEFKILPIHPNEFVVGLLRTFSRAG